MAFLDTNGNGSWKGWLLGLFAFLTVTGTIAWVSTVNRSQAQNTEEINALKVSQTALTTKVDLKLEMILEQLKDLKEDVKRK